MNKSSAITPKHSGAEDRTTLPASGRRWMSLAEVEQYISMCSKTLLKLIRSGEVYGTRKNGKWYVDRDSIDAYFNEERIMLAELRLRTRRH